MTRFFYWAGEKKHLKHLTCLFQEAARSSNAAAASGAGAGSSPDDGDDVESPMPAHMLQPPPVRRRGAISAEPITEEDVASYVKKVMHVLPSFHESRNTSNPMRPRSLFNVVNEGPTLSN